MLSLFARQGVGRMVTGFVAAMAIVSGTLVASSSLSSAAAADPVATTTTLKLNADGTGTVEVTAEGGVTPTNYVDLWIDSTWQKPYTLTAAKPRSIWAHSPTATTRSTSAIARTAPPGAATPSPLDRARNRRSQHHHDLEAQPGRHGIGRGHRRRRHADQLRRPVDRLHLAEGLRPHQRQGERRPRRPAPRRPPDLRPLPREQHHQVQRRHRHVDRPGTVASPTTTTLKLNADGTGTVQVTAENGVTPSNYVDLWIDWGWQKAYALTNGKATIDLGTQPQGDHVVYVRYRDNSTTQASDAITMWTAPGTVDPPRPPP